MTDIKTTASKAYTEIIAISIIGGTVGTVILGFCLKQYLTADRLLKKADSPELHMILIRIFSVETFILIPGICVLLIATCWVVAFKARVLKKMINLKSSESK